MSDVCWVQHQPEAVQRPGAVRLRENLLPSGYGPLGETSVAQPPFQLLGHKLTPMALYPQRPAGPRVKCHRWKMYRV